MAILLNRTAAAFTFSCEKLLQCYGKIYFWTFTFKSVPIDDEYANEDWNALHTRMKWQWPNLRGLRVTELHRSHGIHYHALVNMRIPIERVKRLCLGNGKLYGYNRYLDFGRMSVDRVKDPENTIGYLAKYLRNGYGKDYQLYSGRRWGTIGGFKHIQCRDIEYWSPMHEVKEQMFKGVQVPYITVMMMAHYAKMWGGNWRDWPSECAMLVYRSAGDRWIKEMPDCPF